MKTTTKTMLALFAAVLVVGFAFAAKATKSIWEGPLASGANDVDRQVIDLTAKSFKAGDKLTIYYTAAGIAAQGEAEARPVGPMRDMKKYGDIQLFKADGTTMITSFPQIQAEGTKEYTFEEDVEGIQISFWNLTVTKVDLEAEEEVIPEPEGYIVNQDFASTEGWTQVASDGYRELGNGLIGEFIVYNNIAIAATVDETHLATEYCLGMECRWSTSYASFTQVTKEIPAGAWKLSFDVENVNASTTKAAYENRFTVKVGETVYTDNSTEWMDGKSAWTTHNIEFILDEPTTVEISLGYGTGENNFGAGNTPILYVSHLTLGNFDPAAEAKVALQEEITKAEALLADESKTQGRDAFQAAINDAKALLESTDVNAVNAGVNALKAAEEAFKKANMPLAEGTYYFINAGTGAMMAAGHNWGTQGIVNEIGLDITVACNTDNYTYTFDTQVTNGGNSHYLGSNLYMDAAAFGWTIVPTGDGYTCFISNGTQYIGVDASDNLVLTDAAEVAWFPATAESVYASRLAEMEDATQDNPVSATFLMKNPNFNRNDLRNSAWQATNITFGQGNDFGGNYNVESYHKVFNISQMIEGAPKGVYALTAQGFYRQDGSDNEHLPVFFANDETQVFPLRTGTENSMSQAAASFTSGLYTIEPIFVEVAEGGTLNIGAKLEENTTLWCIFDNFQLNYYGADANIDEIKNAAIIAELAELRAEATNLKAQMDQQYQAALQTALDETANVSGEEAIRAAIQTMQAAINYAKAIQKAKDVLANMKALTEATNFYTAEALNEYYTQWQEKYNAATLTADEAAALQDPNIVTGWHAAITCDNFLLSVWDTNPDFENAPYYINTWSIEGENDGSEFKVPFFEYWIGDGESLGEKTLTATLENVEANHTYDVKAWVRVRIKNGETAPAAGGITMQVNDGDAVDVTAGEQVGSSQFFLNEFTAKGVVAEDGKLTLKFIVSNGNNISWLSFKNVKYIIGEATGISEVNANVNANSKTIYNLRGQKVQNAQKGLYIINGKKVVK